MRFLLGLIAVFVAASSAPAAETTSAQRPDIKIGIILPLSGDVAFQGTDCQTGISLLKKDLSHRHLAFRYNFIIEDDQMVNAQTALATQKLIHTDKVDVLIPANSGPCATAKPFCVRAQVPMIASLASDQSIADGGYCFTNAAKVDKQALLYIQTAKKLDYKRLGILYVYHQGANAVHQSIIRYAKEYGMEIVADEHFIPGERDFRTLWLRIKEKQPDLMLVLAFDPECGIIWKHYKQMGITTPLSSIEWLACTTTLPEINGAWQIGSAYGIYKTGFYERVKKEAPKTDFVLYSAFAYDSVNIVINAYEEWAKTHASGKPTGKEIAALIHQLPYEGALGKITVDKQGVIDSDVGLWIVEKGELKPVDLQELKTKLGK